MVNKRTGGDPGYFYFSAYFQGERAITFWEFLGNIWKPGSNWLLLVSLWNSAGWCGFSSLVLMKCADHSFFPKFIESCLIVLQDVFWMLVFNKDLLVFITWWSWNWFRSRYFLIATRCGWFLWTPVVVQTCRELQTLVCCLTGEILLETFSTFVFMALFWGLLRVAMQSSTIFLWSFVKFYDSWCVGDALKHSIVIKPFVFLKASRFLYPPFDKPDLAWGYSEFFSCWFLRVFLEFVLGWIIDLGFVFP